MVITTENQICDPSFYPGWRYFTSLPSLGKGMNLFVYYRIIVCLKVYNLLKYFKVYNRVQFLLVLNRDTWNHTTVETNV